MEDSDEDSMEMVPIEAVPDDRDQSHCKKAKVTYKQKYTNQRFFETNCFLSQRFLVIS